jgi:hypothetical protein
LNYEKTYSVRANIAVLQAFVSNWIEVVMTRLDVPVSYELNCHLQVLKCVQSDSSEVARRDRKTDNKTRNPKGKREKSSPKEAQIFSS